MIRRHVSAGLLSLLFSVPAVAAAGDGADAADGAALYARYCALGEPR